MIETHFFSSFFLPGVLALIVLGMGMSLTADDFRNILLHPKAVIVGLVSQMILLPGVAIGLSLLAGDWLSAEMKVGLVLVSACPGGATAGLMSHLLKGNVALSVSITTVNSFLTIFTIPAITNIALGYFTGTTKPLVMPFWDTLLHILFITLIPIVIGVGIRARWPNFSLRLEKPLKPIMTTALAIAILAAMFLEKKEGPQIEMNQFLSVFPWALLLNMGGMFFGLYSGSLLRLDTSSNLTIALETGLQNTALAIAIASSQYMLGNPVLAVPAATYAMFSLVTAAIFGLYVQRKTMTLKDIFR